MSNSLIDLFWGRAHSVYSEYCSKWPFKDHLSAQLFVLHLPNRIAKMYFECWTVNSRIEPGPLILYKFNYWKISGFSLSRPIWHVLWFSFCPQALPFEPFPFGPAVPSFLSSSFAFRILFRRGKIAFFRHSW